MTSLSFRNNYTHWQAPKNHIRRRKHWESAEKIYSEIPRAKYWRPARKVQTFSDHSTSVHLKFQFNTKKNFNEKQNLINHSNKWKKFQIPDFTKKNFFSYRILKEWLKALDQTA